MKLLPAAALLLAGVLLADNIHQRMKRSDAEEAFRRLYVIGEMQNRVNSACISSLYSCRSLADDLTVEGMRSITTRLTTKVSRPLPPRPERWRAVADATRSPWP